MSKTTPEGQVLKDIIKYLSFRKHFWIRINTAGIFDARRGVYRPSPNVMPGTPDLLVIHQTQPVFIEVKAPKGKLSADQLLFKAMCDEHGVEFAVARSVEDVIQLGL